jgi:hypothetical protein
VVALHKAARVVLAEAKTPEQRRAFGQNLQSKSDHYLKYAPVVAAAR